jgi:hypothetical protein
MSHNRKSPRRSSGKVGSARSVARLRAVLTATAVRVNAGLTTIAEYMASLGADGDLIRRFAPTLGKHVAKLWREKTGTEPLKCGLALVRSHLVAVFAYDLVDVEILRSAAAGYGRVSHLLNGAS